MTGGRQSVLQQSKDILRARTGDAQVGLRRKVGHGIGGSVAGDGRRGVGSLVDKTSKPMHQPECETIQSSRLEY
jgi:hypothetical protein